MEDMKFMVAKRGSYRSVGMRFQWGFEDILPEVQNSEIMSTLGYESMFIGNRGLYCPIEPIPGLY